jgi:hypothetical protein
MRLRAQLAARRKPGGFFSPDENKGPYIQTFVGKLYSPDRLFLFRAASY